MTVNMKHQFLISERLGVLFLAITLMANAAENVDVSLSVIREFFIGKQKTIIEKTADYGLDPKFEAIKWLEELQLQDKQLELNDENAWSFYIPSLWRALYMNQPDRCDDERLFIAFLDIYSLPKLTNANIFVDDVICAGFNKKIVDKYAESLMKPFLAGKFPANSMVRYQIPKEFAGRFPDFFNRHFAINHRALAEIANPSIKDKCRWLEFNAYFGEPAAAQELISLFRSCSGDATSMVEFNILLEDMFLIASNDSLIAVLSRFPEEIGAPDFDVSGRKRCSPRYAILCGFNNLYPNDPFFIKYKSYIRPQGGIAMDKAIGSETGVKELFGEFRDWAKIKFG